jgi:glycosyltransferase involved in cell wall biosynthesis
MQSQNNLFSVLVANYNNCLYLRDCITSITNQTYTNWELIIVDDASTDSSLQIIDEFRKTDSRIKLYTNNSNKGCGYTKSRCVEYSTGFICGFLDSDDLLYPNAIELMVEAHDKYQGASLIYSNYQLFTEDLKFIRNNEYQFQENFLFMMIGIGLNHFASFKRQYYNKTEGINVTFKRSIDRDLYLKLEEVGQIVYQPYYLYKYRLNPNSISNNNNAFKAEYWAWQARFNACKRRGLDEEEIYSEIVRILNFQNIYYDYRLTFDYKLGNLLLKIPRKIKLLFTSRKK